MTVTLGGIRSCWRATIPKCSPPAPLTLEALAVLVNERLACESELGRVSIDDIRAAVTLGTHPLIDTIAVDGDRVTIEIRAHKPSEPSPIDE
jgi:hypothetical protein